ncbi:ATP-binding protein [Actinoplanes sp. NPDC023801]|uniref:ATP-binding protein n=1 Tax=Actinoplanes sp. NPDC023801 TaxID=3154595 RepID=UPI0033C86575
MSIRYEVNSNGANLMVALSGELGLANSTQVRDRLLKCLAEQPDSLLVDLSAMRVQQPLALAIFPAVMRQAARWPGTPVLFCSPTADTREHLSGQAFQRLPVFDGRDAALAHLHDRRLIMPSISEELLPVSGSSRHARDVTTDACLRWDLPELIAPASLVVTELVANVVDHAGTMMTLRLSLRPRYLNVAVRDGSHDPPVAAGPASLEASRGRGLLLVTELAYRWGYLPSQDGKVVWAALRRT